MEENKSKINENDKENNMIKDGVLHVHVDSRFDTAWNFDKMFSRAKELGAKAVGLTDHGVLTGVEIFMDKAKTYGIKPIPGVEGYFEEDGDIKHRAHIVLLPKDNEGYHAICRAVTASNHRMDSMNMPRMNMKILQDNFGVGSAGHEHVIATSACAGGMLASILLRNQYVDSDVKKIEAKRSKLHDPTSVLYLQSKERVKLLTSQDTEMGEEIKRLQALAKKPYTKKEKALKMLEGKDEYQERADALAAEKKESADAVVDAEKLKKERAALRKKIKEANDRNKDAEKDHIKWNTLTQQIEELEAHKVMDYKLREEAAEMAKKLSELFGDGNFYCEVQNHGIVEESYVMPIIAEIAHELHLPLVATNDVHMATNSEEDIKSRQIMRSLRFNKWESVSNGDRELYMKTDDELREWLLKILDEKTVDEAMNNIGTIIDACDVMFPDEKHYPTFHSDVPGEKAIDCLKRMATNGIEWRYPNREGWTKSHEERVDYEFKVIEKLGVSDYLCIVEDFLRYGRLLGRIDLNNEQYLADPYNIQLLEQLAHDKVGVGIGPGRGSAVGSLVCYLAGITSVDPIKYNLIFERFLNTERVSMPDIDSDFRPDIREKVLDYVKNKYGQDAVCCIMTRGTQQARAAIRNCARLLGDEKFGDTKRFLALGDSICKAVPNELGVKLTDCMETLRNKFSADKEAMTIINNALLVEGVFTNVGMHAAGVIISDNGDVGEYVPLMYIPGKDQFATQCDKDYAESKGLLKMDFLGLRNLGIINETVKMVKAHYGNDIDIERVPFEQEVFKKIFADGNTNSVFQFESSGIKQLLRQFKPENIEDVILLVAAYRPGPMQYLDSIIAVKRGKKNPDYVIPEMETVLGTTYGYPVYQEQIMQIFNKFAGFSLGESDIIRRYMSKKKTEKFMAYKDKFVNGMIERGGKKEKVEEFWNQLVEFSKYAFNKSHAAAYAHVAYYTGWLKYHYTREYLCAVMNDTEFEKLGGLIGDCKTFGIKVLPANINKSEEGFSVSGDEIVCGLGQIKTVGNSAALIINERHVKAYASFADFLMRTGAASDVCENLVKAGAFDEFVPNRTSLINAIPDYASIVKKIKDKKAAINDERSSDTKREKAEKALPVLLDSLKNVAVDMAENENFKKRLADEKSVVGAFVSAHPLDEYNSAVELNCTPIDSLTPQKQVSVMGIITGLRIVSRKSDGSKMAFFKLEDQTGTVNVCCFAKEFVNCIECIAEDAVVKITGSCQEDYDSFSEQNETKIVVRKVETLHENKQAITLFVPSIMAWTDNIYDKVKAYQDENGCPLIIYCKLEGVFRKTNLVVGRDILTNKLGLVASM